MNICEIDSYFKTTIKINCLHNEIDKQNLIIYQVSVFSPDEGEVRLKGLKGEAWRTGLEGGGRGGRMGVQ